MFNLLSFLLIPFMGAINSESFPRVLSSDEEFDLLNKSASGDIEARNLLIEHNLRLVAHIIKKYENTKIDKDDLLSIGSFGLIKAVDSYKLESGIEDVVTYLDKNASKNITLYTDYHTGSYVEFDSYKPYIDSRAEVFLKKNNGKKDVLDEYYKLLNGTLDMDKFIDTYKFDYIMVNRYEKFYEFIKKNEDYELVYEGKNKITFLFKRKYSQT